MKKVSMIAILALASMITVVSAAAQTVIVTPSNSASLGWSTADTRPGGAAVINGDQPRAGNGSLNLTTDATTTAKAQFMHAANVALADVTDLGYDTYQASASFAGGDASYQLPVCLGGIGPATTANPTGCIGFTTFVFEPYENGAVAPLTWQTWDVDGGLFWSSRSYTDGSCTVVAGAGGPPFYTLAGLNAVCPNAVAVGFGVNVGSNNPSYNVFADMVSFNGTTYNFELFEVATNGDPCKNGGWMTLKRSNGSTFKNQGDCVSYTKNGK